MSLVSSSSLASRGDIDSMVTGAESKVKGHAHSMLGPRERHPNMLAPSSHMEAYRPEFAYSALLSQGPRPFGEAQPIQNSPPLSGRPRSGQDKIEIVCP